MKVNKKLLDLKTICRENNLEEIFELYQNFKDAKFDMEVCLALLKEDYLSNPTPDSERDAEYSLVSTQLYYAKENLKIIEKAILYYENKSFRVFKIKGQFYEICLN